ncbi:MAG TPA: hypothetical protein VJU84_14160 [Pyrinomonadaceae bacterium]|nr:hypothetical protein [Pyrinomonadaceae bacterium]
MKISKSIVSLFLLLSVSLSCKLVDRFRSGGVVSGDYSKVAAGLPNYDPKAPAPSPGAEALRLLAELEPGVDKLAGDVEAAERAALKTGLGELRAQLGTEPLSRALEIKERKGPTLLAAKSPIVGTAFPALFLYQGRVDSAIGGANATAVIGALVTGLNDIFAPNVPVGANLNKSVTEKEGGATSTMSLEIGRADDGSTKLGLGLKTEVTKDNKSAKADLAAKIDGQRCPNAEGQLPFTIKVTLGAESGGATYSRDVTAMVRALVNDDAQVEGYTMDLTQATRQVKNGVAVYVETATTMKHDGGNYSESNFRVIRHSQSATKANAEPLSIAGLEAAFATGLTALKIAEQRWLSGACTKIEAPSPGTVAPSSNTSIPVTVRHKFDGSEVPSKLDAALKGETSVDPTTLAKTRGTLTYTAPGEAGKSATITLTATSRRGKATLDLNANTGGASYQIAGGLDDWQTNSKVCDIMKPFQLTGGGFTMELSGGLSGTYTYTGPFNAHGSGTYTISLPDGLGKPGTMTGGGAGSAGGYTNTGTEKYTLTPIPPCN